jgi:hypothetical protein
MVALGRLEINVRREREIREAIKKNQSRFRSLASDTVGPPRLHCPCGLGGVVNHGLSLAGGFSSSFNF